MRTKSHLCCIYRLLSKVLIYHTFECLIRPTSKNKAYRMTLFGLSWTIFAHLLQAHRVAEAKTTQYDPEAPRAGRKVTRARRREATRALVGMRFTRPDYVSDGTRSDDTGRTNISLVSGLGLGSLFTEALKTVRILLNRL